MPAFTSCSFQNAFTIRPDPISSTSASASSAVTSTARNRLAATAPRGASGGRFQRVVQRARRACG